MHARAHAPERLQLCRTGVFKRAGIRGIQGLQRAQPASVVGSRPKGRPGPVPSQCASRPRPPAPSRQRNGPHLPPCFPPQSPTHHGSVRERCCRRTQRSMHSTLVPPCTSTEFVRRWCSRYALVRNSSVSKCSGTSLRRSGGQACVRRSAGVQLLRAPHRPARGRPGRAETTRVGGAQWPTSPRPTPRNPYRQRLTWWQLQQDRSRSRAMAASTPCGCVSAVRSCRLNMLFRKLQADVSCARQLIETLYSNVSSSVLLDTACMTGASTALSEPLTQPRSHAERIHQASAHDYKWSSPMLCTRI